MHSKVAQKDVGSLPLESYALVTSLVYWGLNTAATERVQYYLQTYVRNASGVTPEEHTGMVPNPPGPPGSIDMKHWNGSPDFADGLSDYGRWLDLWVTVARVAEGEGNADWVTISYGQMKLMAVYLMSLPANSSVHVNSTSGIGEGLIWGPAEHDQTASKTFWFSVNTWSWRGLVEFGRFLDDSIAIKDDETRAQIKVAVASLEIALARATKTSLVNDADGKPYFIPPFVAADFPPYTSMINDEGPVQDYGGGSSYANFRYFSEMLSSGYFAEEIEVALSNFRENHTGTLSGMTRFRDHLDDMPAAGYAISAIALDRIPSFLSLMFGHIANYHSRGTYNAPEQMSLYGDGVPGRWTYFDSYRGMLREGGGDIDLDFCVPSTTLLAYMLKHLLVFEPRDSNAIWLLKGAPRRFYAPNTPAVTVTDAVTRYGSINYQLNISASGTFTTVLEWDLHGRGYTTTTTATATTTTTTTTTTTNQNDAATATGGGSSGGTGGGSVGTGGTGGGVGTGVDDGSKLQVVVRLRDHSGTTRSARNPKVLSGDCVVAALHHTQGRKGDVERLHDHLESAVPKETVVVTLSGTSKGVAGKGKCTIVASLAD